MAKTKKSFDYGDPFPSRFRNLIEKKKATLDALAAEFNTTRQTVSNWQNGVTVPDAVSICDIARYFGVTTDYLLGLTDVKTIETNVRAVAEYTGLSEDAVKELHFPYYQEDAFLHNMGHNVYIIDEDSPRIDDNETWMISQLIEDGALYTIASYLGEIWDSTVERTKSILQKKRKIENERFNDEFYEELFYYHNQSMSYEEFSKDSLELSKFKKSIDGLSLDELAHIRLMFDNPGEITVTEIDQFRIQKIIQEFIARQIKLAEGFATEQDEINGKTN